MPTNHDRNPSMQACNTNHARGTRPRARASRDHYDAIVVGARCAGAAVALRMAEQGLRVLAVDRSPYGSDTHSTHALMRPAVYLLKRWGVLDRIRAANTPPIRTTTFYYPDGSVEVPIKVAGGVDALYAPRRTVLDAALADAARERGAEVLHEVRVGRLLRDRSGRVAGAALQLQGGAVQPVRAPLVIGADGTRSSVARWVGAPVQRRARHATAGFYAYFSGLPATGYHWYFAPEISIGSIATNDDLTLVCVSVSPERFARGMQADRHAAFLRALREVSPRVAVAVTAARREGPLHGFPAERGFHRACVGPGWALVGDAGYFRDPLTAHGITDAFRDAELLARAAADGSEGAFAAYQTARDANSLRFAELTDEVASLQWDHHHIKHLHKEMSREMNRELEALQALDGVTHIAPVAAHAAP